MNHKLIFTLALTSVLVGFWACQEEIPHSEDGISAAQKTNEELVAEGALLVHKMDCSVCHSPKLFTPQGPVFDTTRLLSGHPADLPLEEYDPASVTPGKWTLTNAHFTAWVGVWGTSFAANLTPDATGLGDWSLDHFKTAIRHGKSKGLMNGRDLLPPMPWQAYAICTDDEILAIWTYLQSLPPIENIVPVPLPPVTI